MKTFYLVAEVLLYRLFQIAGLFAIGGQLPGRYTQFVPQHNGRAQGIIIERGSAEIRIAGRETVLQFIRIGSDYACRGEFAVAIFQTPFDEGPEFTRFFLVSTS